MTIIDTTAPTSFSTTTITLLDTIVLTTWTVCDTTTVTITATTADINISDTTIYVDTTSGYAVGDFVSCVTPGIFASLTLITVITPGISIDSITKIIT